MSSSNGLTIGELEANYSLYCKALRRLLQEGRSRAAIQRTIRTTCARCSSATWADAITTP
jgi:hypothetical protein